MTHHVDDGAVRIGHEESPDTPRFVREGIHDVEPTRDRTRMNVVDISDFLRKLVQVTPWISRPDERPVSEREYLQTPAEMEEYQQFSMCINCMLCYSACPIYALDPEFIGPAAIALAQRYNLDSRDAGAHLRLDVLNTPDGVWACTFVGECTTACPKDVDPAAAIQRYKLTAAMESVKGFLLPRGAR